MTPFQGLSAFPITPADDAGQVDTAALARLLERLATAGVDSIGLLGSTGSYPYFDRTQRRRAIDTAREVVAGRVPVLVGIGALRTTEVVQYAQDAQAGGADALLLAPVSYTPLTEREVFVLFETVAAAVDLPICIYNNPGTTHFTFSPELQHRLSQIRGVSAAKNPAPEAEAVAAYHAGFLTRMPPGFALGYSGDWRATEALLAGGVAWYSVLGGLFPRPCLEIMQAVRAGDATRARALHNQLQPLWDLFIEFSSLRVVYAAANLLDLCQAAPPRPILPLDEAAQSRVAATLEQLGLH